MGHCGGSTVRESGWKLGHLEVVVVVLVAHVELDGAVHVVVASGREVEDVVLLRLVLADRRRLDEGVCGNEGRELIKQPEI